MTAADHRRDALALVHPATGTTRTYDEVDERSMRLARLLRATGLRVGDHVAVLLENRPEWFEVFWATQRSGLYITPVPVHLGPEDAGAVIEDCGATALVTSAGLGDLVRFIGPRRLAGVRTRLVVGGDLDGFTEYESALAAHRPTPLARQPEGGLMLYSSGTTGPPRTTLHPLSGADFGEGPNSLAVLMRARWDFGPDTTFLCAGPMYHGGFFGFATGVQRLGGTVVLMDGFDAARTLELIEQHRVTHVLLAPFHFVQLLKLDDATRSAHDLSSLRVAIHAVTPCPIEVKRRMLEWWGPIVHEYYTGAEAHLVTIAEPADWLAHPGTVGKVLVGTAHVLDEEGIEVAVGEAGQIWAETETEFEYHDDPAATEAAHDARGWSTVGDVGRLDEDGYLYVTGRVSDVVVRDGERVDLQAIEGGLALHPLVADVAVVGVPVTGLVVLADGVDPSDEVAAELVGCSELDAVTFVDALPRLPTGKLAKRLLRRH